MNKAFTLPIWTANCCGNNTNCYYPNSYTATNVDSLKNLVSNDHTFIRFKNNYRGSENFIYTDALVVDCDNTHSDNREDWVNKEDIVKEFKDVAMIIYTSRNHMKPKEGKSPRPRYHVIFFIERITDPDTYKEMLQRVQDTFPIFDTQALDAGRFFYGNPNSEIYYQPGFINLSMFFDEDSFARMDKEIPEGSRNATMFKWAIRSMKRYGNTEESKSAFYRQAEKCNPPLNNDELASIWNSAAKYYKKIAAEPGYIPPAEYNNSNPTWEEPIPFGRYELDPFPVSSLPDDIGEYVKAVAESTQTPIDMAGVAALTLIAVCVQGKYAIQGKSDWIEPLNIFSNIIASPSERKSAVLHADVYPLDEYEVQYNRRNAARYQSVKMRKHVLERRQKSIEDQVAKGKAEPKDLDKIAKEIADFIEEKPIQLYVDDITTEKLVSVMSSNKGRAAIVSSEGGIFDTLAGIYTKNVNIDVMLKGYSGDTIRVDRIGRESESVMNPSLTILLMTQPKVISEVLGNATFRGRGLTARFLYCLPTSSVGERKFQSIPVSDEVRQQYERKMVNMLEEEYPEKPEIITLSDDASKLITSFAEEIEPKIKNEFAEIADWAGKLVGNTLRIAGLLCRADVFRTSEFLTENAPLVVDVKTMAKAVRLGRYFLSHALAVYDVIPEATMHRDANRILKMIRDKNLTVFDRRTAMRNCRVFKTVSEIQPVLDFLEDYGYILRECDKSASSGRPPLPKYSVNPTLFPEKQ